MADNRKLSVLILKTRSSDEQLELTQRWKENEDLFLAVTAILDQKKEETRTKQLNSTNYSLPGWSEFQADCNGYQRALNEVISLISLRDTL
jgi:hypothetical protein